MRSNYVKFGLGLAISCLTLAGASAADRLVGAGQAYTTISAAIEAAVDGDVIRIMDSAVYEEKVVINKSVQVMADGEHTPTIKTPDGLTGDAVLVTTGAQGGQFGSLAGGRINVDRNLPPDHATTGKHGIMVNGILVGQEYTIENVYVTGFTTGGVVASHVTGYDATCGVKGTLHLKNIEIDGKHTADAITGAAKTGVRVVGGSASNKSNEGATIRMNRVLTKNLNSHAMILNNSSTAHLPNVTAVIEDCELTTLKDCGIQMGNNPGINLSVNNSFLLGGGIQNSWGALRYGTTNNTTVGPPSGTISIRNSVLAVWPLAGTAMVIGASGTDVSNDTSFTIDHCDIINQLGGGTTITDQTPRARTAINFAAGSNRTLTFTNNNVYGPDASGDIVLAGITVVPGAGDVITVSHNNVFVSGADYTGVTPGAGTVQPGVNPNYVDAANGNYTVQNPAIQTASMTGGVLGSGRSASLVVPVELSTFSLQ